MLELSPLDKIDLYSYDKIIIFWSGGKDSLACLLWAKEQGIENHKIELWHHCVDGSPDSKTFFDWECTTAYCRAIADYFHIPIYFSWLDGGFKKAMLKKNDRKAATFFETPYGLQSAGGVDGDITTREMFPALTSNLQRRWCSSELKIDVASIAIRNQPRFKGQRILCLSGERAEESPNRAKYKYFEPHRTHTKSRHVDVLRPVHSWKEQSVWAIISYYGIFPHVAYYLHFNRVSCKWCIFGDKDQMASAHFISPDVGFEISDYEKLFGKTIKTSGSGKYTKKIPILDFIASGTAYDMKQEYINQAISKTWYMPLKPKTWLLPDGAYGKGCGPT